MHKYKVTATHGRENGKDMPDLIPVLVEAQSYIEAFRTGIRLFHREQGQPVADRVWDIKVVQVVEVETNKAKVEKITTEFCINANNVAVLMTLANSKQDFEKIALILSHMKAQVNEVKYINNGINITTPE